MNFWHLRITRTEQGPAARAVDTRQHIFSVGGDLLRKLLHRHRAEAAFRSGLESGKRAGRDPAMDGGRADGPMQKRSRAPLPDRDGFTRRTQSHPMPHGHAPQRRRPAKPPAFATAGVASGGGLRALFQWWPARRGPIQSVRTNSPQSGPRPSWAAPSSALGETKTKLAKAAGAGEFGKNGQGHRGGRRVHRGAGKKKLTPRSSGHGAKSDQGQANVPTGWRGVRAVAAGAYPRFGG